MDRRITDVFFDLDHTLWDFEKNSALAFAAIFSKHGLALDLEGFLAHYVPVNRKYWDLYQFDKITQEQLRYGRFRDAFDLMGFTATDQLIAALSDDYIAHLPQYNHLFEGTLEILDYLQSRYRLHIITNGFDKVQGRKIRNANIGHYFQTVTNSELAGVKKPDPGIFNYAMALAQADKTSSMMIGDSFEADIQGALDCGLDAIYFNCDNKAINQDVKQVSSLMSLKNYL